MAITMVSKSLIYYDVVLKSKNDYLLFILFIILDSQSVSLCSSVGGYVPEVEVQIRITEYAPPGLNFAARRDIQDHKKPYKTTEQIRIC